MMFSIQRETLLKPLLSLISIADKRHAIPVLANILIVVSKDNKLTLTATDLEVELIANLNLQGNIKEGTTTVPARKLMDICRSLPEGCVLEVALEKKHRMVIISNASRFSISTLPAGDFPSIDADFTDKKLGINQHSLLRLLRRTFFAMAQHDVRYFLNGLLLEVANNKLTTVGTDGHRLALASATLKESSITEKIQAIIPRKTVVELIRLLHESDDNITILFGSKHVRMKLGDYVFTSTLVEGRYPNYLRVIPKVGEDNVMRANTEELKQALCRAAILSNEKYKGVRLTFDDNMLQLVANNPEQEESHDKLPVNYQGEKLEIGFNVNYLLDVFTALEENHAEFSLAKNSGSVIIKGTAGPDDASENKKSDKGEGEGTTDFNSLYVVMPMGM